GQAAELRRLLAAVARGTTVCGGGRGHGRARSQERLAPAHGEDVARTAVALLRGFGSGAAMSELLLVAGVFALAFVSAFVPLVSIELALVMAAATGTSGGLLVGQVLAAAAGQMIGKSCFFL